MRSFRVKRQKRYDFQTGPKIARQAIGALCGEKHATKGATLELGWMCPDFIMPNFSLGSRTKNMGPVFQ